MEKRDRIEQRSGERSYEPLPSPWRARLAGTLLGTYLETREPRYLFALILYAVAYGLIAGLIIFAFQHFRSGAILQGYNAEFYAKLLNTACAAAVIMCFGSVAAGRYALTLRLVPVSVVLIVLAYLRA